jgi:hypothetical protein
MRQHGLGLRADGGGGCGGVLASRRMDKAGVNPSELALNSSSRSQH